MNLIYKKLCPVCDKEQIYSCKLSLNKAIIENSLCYKCRGKKQRKMVDFIFFLNENWCKRCPSCNDIMTYVSRNSAMKYRDVRCNSCAKKGTKRNDEVKRKLSLQKMGKNNPMFGKVSFMRGKHHTEETKYKLRLATIKDLQNKRLLPSQKNYNPIACGFIDNINKEKGWNLQHAMNGGEIEIYGYFVDGYDKERNIIFEYDEPKHEVLSIKKRDEVRQQRIIEKIKPMMFIRYKEKFGKFVEVISGKEWV